MKTQLVKTMKEVIFIPKKQRKTTNPSEELTESHRVLLFRSQTEVEWNKETAPREEHEEVF